MGPPRSHRRGPKPVLPLRSRTTRSSKGKLLSDPDANTQQLTEQLRQLGLYAADTTGDGNCLFRALSDQLYGTESRHLQIRKDICDWIQSHSVRYAPFVDDERGLDVHLSLMRQPATYGGHLELSAFAHMKKCNVKVIQPGLVYLIEWAAGWEAVAAAKDTPTSSTSSLATTLVEREPILNDRSRRAARRESRRAERVKARADSPATDEDDVHKDNVTPTVYVAYHDWEHFSSIRNLRGPHSGLPDVSELPADASPPDLPSPKSSSKPASKARLRAASSASTTKLPSVPVSGPKPLSRPRRTSRVLRQSGSSATVIPAAAPPTPADIPLPSSRSSSPPPAPSLPPGLHTREREQRSPKRSFDESSGSSDVSAASTSAAKRTRRGTVRGLAAIVPDADAEMDADADVDGDRDADADDADTPALSETASLSPISSPSPSPSPSPVPAPAPRRLTKRERKSAGLSRHRGGVGKIVIPGGRFRAVADDKGSGLHADVQGEWARNGTGRVDVRGFRELRI